MKTALQIAAIGLAFGLVGTAHAQDSYVFSGMLDIGYYKDYDGETKTGSISRSNVAFTANKDVGGGMAVTGKVNARFWLRNPNTKEYLVNEDSKYLGSGETTVGLKGEFGHVRVGRALTALWNNDWAYDAWYNYDQIASPAWWLWHGNSAADPNASAKSASFARLNDGVFYSSPSFNGFSADVSYGAAKRTADRNHSTSIALKYDQKNYAGMIAREKTPVGNTVTFLAAKATFGDLSVMGGYDDEKLQGGGKNRSVSVSTRYTQGTMSYMLGMGMQRDYDNAKFYSAGVNYAYRPNVNVYASYGNQGRGFWGDAKAKDALGVGVNYSF